MPTLRAVLAGCCLPALLLLAAPCATAQAQAQAENCEDAAHVAELAQNLPPGLLAAVGHVESGGGLGGALAVNFAGRGVFFANLAQAMAAVRAAQAQGVQRIDVGCFQVDLFYHPDAFAELRDAFDPMRNAHAAANLLRQLYGLTQDWSLAVMRYHSARPDLGGPYRDRVMADWQHAPRIILAALPDPFMLHLSGALPILRVVHPHDAEAEGGTGLLPRIITPHAMPRP